MQAGTFDLGHGLKATHSFSSKPDGGYTDYHHKMTSYANIIAGPAAVLKPGMTPRVFREPEEEEDSVVQLCRDRLRPCRDRRPDRTLANERVAIIGVGGTGGYILDFVAKTPVSRDPALRQRRVPDRTTPFARQAPRPWRNCERRRRRSTI